MLVVKCLLSMCEALGLIPRTKRKKVPVPKFSGLFVSQRKE